MSLKMINIMVLTKGQIKKLQLALKKANKLECQSQMAAQNISSLIEEFTGVAGCVDHLQGDGFGFTPETNMDTHIPIYELIQIAKEGIDITHDEIDKRRCI